MTNFIIFENSKIVLIHGPLLYLTLKYYEMINTCLDISSGSNCCIPPRLETWRYYGLGRVR
jgi:hypothetical protein